VTHLPVKLYTRPGCHLCEQAVADLERLRSRHPHTLELVDITADEALMLQYSEQIPVLRIGAREYAAPLPRAVIERALKEARAD
jgi:glutaredoxin